MKLMAHSRKLLLVLSDDEEATPSLRNNLFPTSTFSPDPELLPPLNSSSAIASSELTNKQPNSPFNSSMALTVLVLLTALFFMAFFSVYIRRFSDDDAADLRRRRQHRGPPSSSSSSSSSFRFRPTKIRGLDPSTVRSLPLVAYGGAAAQLIDCAICLSEFEERETVKMIPCCRHVFHPSCIDTWLASHVSCPLCRSTKMYGVEEVCSSVMQVDNDQSMSEDSRRRSTVVESDTWKGEGPVALRRACSCSSLGERVVLQRSRSF